MFNTNGKIEKKNVLHAYVFWVSKRYLRIYSAKSLTNSIFPILKRYFGGVTVN